MNKRVKRIHKFIVPFICMSLLLSMIPSGFMVKAFAATTQEKIDQAEALRKETEKAKNETSQKKENLKGEKEQLQSYLSDLNNDLAEISDNLSDLESKIDKKQQEIDVAKEEVEKAISAEESQYEFMKNRIKYMYERGETTLLEAFFSSKSYGDFLNKAEYSSRAEEYDQKMYANLIQLREEIQEKEAKLEEEARELDGLRDAAKEEESKVNALVANANGSLSATNSAISVAEMEEAAYNAELAVQDKVISELKKQLAEELAMSKKAAKMAWRNISELTFEESDRDLLACLIYCEAGNQPYEGQVAVGAVVINRMRSAAFPNTMVGVIYQNKQFSPVASGRLASRIALGANQQCYNAADDAMKGASPVGNCLYFRTIIPEINGQIIGAHVFY